GAARISVEVAAWWRVNRPFPRNVVCAAVANYRRFLLQDREPQGEHVGIRALLRFLRRRGFCELCIVLGVLSGTPAGAQVCVPPQKELLCAGSRYCVPRGSTCCDREVCMPGANACILCGGWYQCASPGSTCCDGSICPPGAKGCMRCGGRDQCAAPGSICCNGTVCPQGKHC